MVFDRKEYMKQYRLKNKEKVEEYKKEWSLKNKEKQQKQMKEWYENNKEKQQKQIKEWYKTEKGLKCNRIKNWKASGLIHDDYEKLYADYINTLNCNVCNHDFSKYVKCMDHDHDTGLFRYFLCKNCNNFDNWKKI